MASQDRNTFISAVEACDYNTVEEYAGIVSPKVLDEGYSNAFNQMRIAEREGYTSDYRELVEIIKDAANKRGIQVGKKPKTAKN